MGLTTALLIAATLPPFVVVGEGEFVQRQTTYSPSLREVVVTAEPRFDDGICWAPARIWQFDPNDPSKFGGMPEPHELALFPDVDASSCTRAGITDRHGIGAMQVRVADAAAAFRILDATLRPSRPLVPLCAPGAYTLPAGIDTSTLVATDLAADGDPDALSFEVFSDAYPLLWVSVEIERTTTGWVLGRVVCSWDVQM